MPLLKSRIDGKRSCRPVARHTLDLVAIYRADGFKSFGQAIHFCC